MREDEGVVWESGRQLQQAVGCHRALAGVGVPERFGTMYNDEGDFVATVDVFAGDGHYVVKTVVWRLAPSLGVGVEFPDTAGAEV